ncbi:hypothetical protein SSX86_015452 [Deinandra increscens subsp. villosa]|uniref:RST domain-containing protein n=1 Tax=Deinandra increscens subsp. villosa TaxID=3103831 RepID=A0AAP0D4K0_9ASTR
MSQVAMSMQNADKSPAKNIGLTLPADESQLQRTGNQQAMTTGQPANTMNRSARQVPFAHLIPAIEAQLDKDRAKQLQSLYAQLQSNNINKEEFVLQMRSLVGDHIIKKTVYKFEQGQMMENTSNQPAQITAKPSSLPMDNNAQKPRLSEHQPDAHEVHKSSKVIAIKQEWDQPFSVQGLGEQYQQEHTPFTQLSVSNYGNTGGSYSSPDMVMSSQSFNLQTNDFTSSLGLQQSSWQPLMHRDQSLMSSMAYIKQEPLDYMNDQQHNYQTSVPQGLSSFSLFESSEEESFEMMSSRPGFLTSMNAREPITVTAQLERQNASAGNSSLAVGGNTKSPQKSPTDGQKKTLEILVYALRKKQKVSGAFSHQSMERLNDVTAVSGVNLWEKEESFFSGSKEDSQVSEASRKVIQEEDRLVLQNTPLQKKLSEITVKRGAKNRSSDVEPCLSPLHDHDGDVEILDPKQERCELDENVPPLSESVENLSSPCIICVQGYKVKRENATILEAIFKKHGDIATNCIFKTSSARTYHLEVICEVVKRIQTKDMIEIWEDIESQVSDAEAANINVSWIRAHFEAIQKSKETNENHSLLVETKENTIFVKQAAQMDLRKRSRELVAAQERFKEAERCVRVLDLVEKNLNDRILESKSKIDTWVKHSVV